MQGEAAAAGIAVASGKQAWQASLLKAAAPPLELGNQPWSDFKTLVEASDAASSSSSDSRDEETKPQPGFVISMEVVGWMGLILVAVVIAVCGTLTFCDAACCRMAAAGSSAAAAAAMRGSNGSSSSGSIVDAVMSPSGSTAAAAAAADDMSANGTSGSWWSRYSQPHVVTSPLFPLVKTRSSRGSLSNLR
jgi:hypothetical protein